MIRFPNVSCPHGPNPNIIQTKFIPPFCDGDWDIFLNPQLQSPFIMDITLDAHLSPECQLSLWSKARKFPKVPKSQYVSLAKDRFPCTLQISSLTFVLNKRQL